MFWEIEPFSGMQWCKTVPPFCLLHGLYIWYQRFSRYSLKWFESSVILCWITYSGIDLLRNVKYSKTIVKIPQVKSGRVVWESWNTNFFCFWHFRSFSIAIKYVQKTNSKTKFDTDRHFFSLHELKLRLCKKKKKKNDFDEQIEWRRIFFFFLYHNDILLSSILAEHKVLFVILQLRSLPFHNFFQRTVREK